MCSKKARNRHSRYRERNAWFFENWLDRGKPWLIQDMVTFTPLKQWLPRKPIVCMMSLFAVILLSLGATFARAEDATLSDILSLTWPEETKLPDRFVIRGGYGYAFGATTTLRANGPAGSGTTLDFEDDLGGDTSGSLARTDLIFRFNSRHAVGGTWYKLDREGSLVSQRDFNWDGLTYRTGGAVVTNLNIELFRLWYMWSFYRGEKLELAFAPGVYAARIEADIAGTLTVADTAGGGAMASAGAEVKDLTLPLPSFGFIGNYKILPRLTTNIRGDGFYLAVNEWSGWMAEAYAGVDYRVLQNFSLGVAYNFFAVNVKRDNSTEGWQIDNYWNLVYLYGSLYFFDTPLSD